MNTKHNLQKILNIIDKTSTDPTLTHQQAANLLTAYLHIEETLETPQPKPKAAENQKSTPND